MFHRGKTDGIFILLFQCRLNPVSAEVIQARIPAALVSGLHIKYDFLESLASLTENWDQ